MQVEQTTVTRCAIALAALTVLGIWRRYSTDLRGHRARVSRGSHVVSSRFGQIEFALVGTGPPVLVAHGAGGGFDQALTAARRLTAAGFRVIAPSRFGYLRSSSPEGVTLADQADAYAVVLDALGVDHVAVIGVSVGALSALEFAVRHPGRCGSLIVIVPAASAAGEAVRVQGRFPEQGPMAGTVIEKVLRSDLLYWLGVTLAPHRMARSVLGCDPAVIAVAEPAEQNRAQQILRDILPVSSRRRGVLVDARFVTAPQAIAVDTIRAPTLVVSVEDDYYRTMPAARLIAANVPYAQLLTYPTGGHVWVGHDAELFGRVDAFLRDNQPADRTTSCSG